MLHEIVKKRASLPKDPDDSTAIGMKMYLINLELDVNLGLEGSSSISHETRTQGCQNIYLSRQRYHGRYVPHKTPSV